MLSFFYISFTHTSYPWLAKSRGGHSAWDMAFLYVNYVFAINFVHKFSIGVSMELVVVDMDITFLTSGKTFKVYFLPHENGHRVLWLASYIYRYCSIMIFKAGDWQTLF